MRNRSLIFVSALLLVFVFACKKSETTITDTSTTTTSATDTSATTTTDTAMSATTTGSTGGTVSNLSAEDKDFVMKAAAGGMAEVQMGQTAQSKAQNADVKAFGKRMVDDHGKANDELKTLATNKGLALPAEIDQAHKDAAQHLSSMSGKDFDKTYMSHMVDDHEKDVKEFEKAAKDATDADIKAWASKTLPTLQDHLRQAKETQKKVK